MTNTALNDIYSYSLEGATKMKQLVPRFLASSFIQPLWFTCVLLKFTENKWVVCFFYLFAKKLLVTLSDLQSRFKCNFPAECHVSGTSRRRDRIVFVRQSCERRLVPTIHDYCRKRRCHRQTANRLNRTYVRPHSILGYRTPVKMPNDCNKYGTVKAHHLLLLAVKTENHLRFYIVTEASAP